MIFMCVNSRRKNCHVASHAVADVACASACYVALLRKRLRSQCQGAASAPASRVNDRDTKQNFSTNFGGDHSVVAESKARMMIGMR